MFNYGKALLAQKTPEGVDNNMCESFNNWIVAIRAHPIITMLEGLRCKTFVRTQENRFKLEKWTGRICSNIVKKIKQIY